MQLEPMELLSCAGVVLLGSYLQSMVGFAFTLFVVPVLLLLGWEMPEAVGIAFVGSLAQRAMAVHYHFADVPWRKLWPLMIAGLIAVPVGVLLLKILSQRSQPIVQQVVGSVVIGLVVLRALLRTPPREEVPLSWGLAAAAASGVLNGFANIGGPPIILWVHAHQWHNERLRATTAAFSLALAPAQLALFIAFLGTPMLWALLKGVILIPAIALGAAIGLRMGDRLSVTLLRRATGLLLVCLGATLILKPLL